MDNGYYVQFKFNDKSLYVKVWNMVKFKLNTHITKQKKVLQLQTYFYSWKNI